MGLLRPADLRLCLLARSGFLGTRGSADRPADIDVVLIVATGQVVETTVGFGEGRQVERETCGAADLKEKVNCSCGLYKTSARRKL